VEGKPRPPSGHCSLEEFWPLPTTFCGLSLILGALACEQPGVSQALRDTIEQIGMQRHTRDPERNYK
jgi:hypothetical protein